MHSSCIIIIISSNTTEKKKKNNMRMYSENSRGIYHCILHSAASTAALFLRGDSGQIGRDI